MGTRTPIPWKPFVLRIVLPSLLAIGLFVAFIFGAVIPDIESNLLDRKRETIRELTRSAWSILKEYAAEEQSGALSAEDARRMAAARIRDLRYGPESKDYFWITDMRPVMIMHPFRTDLNGRNLSGFRDPLGNRVFVEAVRVARGRGAGYVDYVWQWKDDPSRMAPKQSFVMRFDPWGWVIGTGLYTEDVRAEIAALTRRMIRYSFVISGFVALILLFVVQQSLRLERGRVDAETALRESHEKLRALVEAGTDGTVLVLDGRCTFSNPTFLHMLGYATADLEALTVADLLYDSAAAGDTAGEYLRAQAAGLAAPARVETRIRRKDGQPLDAVLSATRVTLDGKDGLILNVKDVARWKRVEEELGYSRERFRALRAAIDFGVFRATTGRTPRLLEANPAARRILGLDERDDLGGLDPLQALLDPEQREALVRDLAADGVVKDRTVQLRRSRGNVATVSLSAVLVDDGQGRPRWCDGFVEDVTERRRVEAEREALVADLQTSLLFLNEPVRSHVRDTLVCDLHTQVSQAAARMSQGGHDALLVTSDGRDAVGIVTDRDFRERVVAAGLDPGTPLFRIMSAPVVTVSDRALVYEALQVMREHAIRHVAVRAESGGVAGLVRNVDLAHFHRFSPAVLTQEIQRAGSVADLAACRARLPSVVQTLLEAGARAVHVNRVVTGVSDAITQRLIALALDEAGPPPARFAFLALGSAGRHEQTLVTDQDNAIVYEDLPADARPAAADYFLRLGQRVCDALAEIGYTACPGDVMARNPKWCQPLSAWREAFSGWIRTSNAQDLLAIHVFFDFRPLWGDRSLPAALRQHIQAELAARPAFLPLFAQNALLYRAPLGLFGNFVLESDGRGSPRTFSIKEAMTPIVNFARLYALQHGVAETNTFDRLRALHERNVLRKTTHDEVSEAYAFLMKTRLGQQAAALAQGTPATNAVDPKTLTPLEEAALKKTFGHIAVLQKKIGFDFLGG